MTVEEVIAKYAAGKPLSHAELAFLRRSLPRSKIEAMAIAPGIRGKESRLFYKLANLLYSREVASGAANRPAVRVDLPSSIVRSSDEKGVRRMVSGGSANGTGKRK